MGPGIFDVDDETESGEGRGIDVLLVTNIDLVPSTKWPPSGASFTGGLGADCLSGAIVGLEGPAPGDWGGRGELGLCWEEPEEKGSLPEEDD